MNCSCPNCQKENSAEEKYCSGCGYSLPVKELEKTEPVVLGYKPKKKRHPILIVIIVVFFWAAFFGGYTLLNPTLDALNPSVDAELEKVAADMNRGCPFQVDEITVLVNVKALPNKTIQYNYKLNDLTKTEINLDTVKKYVFPNLLKNAKENPEAKPFRDNDVTIRYHYDDKNGEFITEYVVTPEMYK